MANDSKVLITGASGFLGSHLAESYLKSGATVYGVDNYSSSSKRNAEILKSLYPKRFHFVEADVCQEWSWTKGYPKEMDYVYHFASPASPPIYQELALETMWVNTVGLDHALKFADSKSARVIFASTSEVYGDPEVHPQKESYRGNVNTVGPRSCYDEGKRFGETLLYTHNWKKKTNHGIVRIFNTYGPRMNPRDGRVVINFLVQGIKGVPLTVYGDGKQTRSFCFVDDLIQGIRLYADSKQTQPINIGNDKEFSIIELAEIVRKDIFPAKKLKIVHEGLPVDDPMQRCPNLSLAKKELKWAPKTQLKDGLKIMLQWLSDELGNKK